MSRVRSKCVVFSVMTCSPDDGCSRASVVIFGGVRLLCHCFETALLVKSDIIILIWICNLKNFSTVFKLLCLSIWLTLYLCVPTIRTTFRKLVLWFLLNCGRSSKAATPPALAAARCVEQRRDPCWGGGCRGESSARRCKSQCCSLVVCVLGDQTEWPNVPGRALVDALRGQHATAFLFRCKVWLIVFVDFICDFYDYFIHQGREGSHIIL